MSVGYDGVAEWMRRFAAEIAENKQHLTRLDSAIGDGDHGTNMDRGMRKALELLYPLEGGEPAAGLKAVGMALV